MMAPFPHRYTIDLTRTGHTLATIDASPRPPIEGGAPPEFGGDQAHWSPEHLLLSAIGLCMYTTFEVFAARAKLEILGWSCHVEGQLDKTAGGLAFTSFFARIELVVMPADVERARELLTRSNQHCIVSNALRTPVTIEAQVMAAA
jgi:organic hydroperoxide reductase OsmC/OhrA